MNTTIPKNARLITAEEAATLAKSENHLMVIDGNIREAKFCGAICGLSPRLSRVVGTQLLVLASLKDDSYLCIHEEDEAEYNRLHSLFVAQKRVNGLKNNPELIERLKRSG